jgi:hypothetical protein
VYIGFLALALGIGLVYGLWWGVSINGTLTDPDQPSPGFAALADVFVGVVVGLVLMPLALGSVFVLGRESRNLGGASGCAAIVIAGGVGVVIGLAFLTDLFV